MKVEAINLSGGAVQELPKPVDKLEDARKQKEQSAKAPDVSEKAQIPPEEFLQQVKSLTEDGVFSVRFEKDDVADDLVVKIVDRETDEVIRQVPAEEVLELRAALDDLRGNIVNTQS